MEETDPRMKLKLMESLAPLESQLKIVLIELGRVSEKQSILTDRLNSVDDALRGIGSDDGFFAKVNSVIARDKARNKILSAVIGSSLMLGITGLWNIFTK